MLLEERDMGLPKSKPLFTVEQYLKLERAAEERHEFLDGEIYAMAGESEAHGIISVNLVISLGSQLKGKPCQARTKDTKVRSGPIPRGRQASAGLYSYPDVIVVCGEPKYLDEYKDVLLNPTALVEVLSPSTEAFDRGEKFQRLQEWNPSLRDFLLISQDQPQIEHFTRQADGSWTYQRHAGIESAVSIASIDCTLKLADVYDRLTFPSD